MSDDLLEQKLGSILETAQPVADLPPATRARVLTALADSPEASRGARKRRWRLATGLTFAAVALFGLGFVPFPMGSAKGALAEAMAAFDQFITKHTVRQSWDEQGNEYLTETWFANDGFLRQDEFKGDKLSHVWIMDGTKMLYFYVSEDGQLQAIERFIPHGAYDQQHQVRMPLFGQSSDTVGDIFAMLKRVDAYKHVTINEYQERSMWGGAITIAEVETDHGAPGHGQKWRFEIDPTTDRVMKTIFYVSSGTAEIWKEKSETHYEWDTPIPESAHDFTLPSGTKLTRNLWWQDRIDKVVAQASTPDWEVTLHDVQVDNEGNMIASISTHYIATGEDSKSGFSGFPRFVVDDNVGNEYRNGKSGGVNAIPGHIYWVIPITKAVGGSAAIPTAATFTIHLSQDGASEDQAVVFRNIPLPARQPLSTEDLMHKDDEVVQY